MPSYTSYPITDPDALYAYCPSFGAAVTFTCFFGLVTILHIGYGFRAAGVTDQKYIEWATAQSLLILLAPLWINAFVYMLLGRMVHFFLDDRRVYGVKAKHFTWIFVSLDIISFLVQAIGGLMANQRDMVSIQRTGLNVYMGGMGLQELFIVIFTSMVYRFQQKVGEQERRSLNASEGVSMSESAFRSLQNARKLGTLMYTVLGLITLRIIFRLVEFSQGIESYVSTYEWFPYVFDEVPMLAALIAFNIVYPGRILRGPNSDFSEERKADKQRKKEKKEIKKMKKDAKEAEERAKKDEKGEATTVEDVSYVEV